MFNVLLQVLDDGRLTDGQGRTVDFRNTILIMTSNVGTAEGVFESGDEQDFQAILKGFFRPEFINRIDEILRFSMLGEDQMEPIARRQLDRLVVRLAERDLALSYTDGVVRAVAKEGYDPAFGARPIKRAVQRLVSDTLAEHVLREDWTKGTRLEVDWKKALVVKTL